MRLYHRANTLILGGTLAACLAEPGPPTPGRTDPGPPAPEVPAQWKQHWAFVAPERPAIPSVATPEWVRNEIDAFVRAPLEAAGLVPSATADPATLLRRVTLDLSGLPPTLEELDAFLADPSPAAYARTVDRLLASRRYAENLTREWLDAARYGDTNGFHVDEPRTMWPWRDWVIDAIDRNLPFDEFVIEQIAGDLLPGAGTDQQLATAFQRNHGISVEQGIVEDEYQAGYVADRVATTATAFMGLTLGCARCHDHKFDPFTQRDFYKLFDCFNQVPERGRGNANDFAPRLAARSPLQRAEIQASTASAAALRTALEAAPAAAEEAWEAVAETQLPIDWTVVVPGSIASSAGTPFATLPDGSVLAEGPTPDRDTYTLELVLPFTPSAVRLEGLRDDSLPSSGPGRSSSGNFVLTKLIATIPCGDDLQAWPWIAASADHAQPGFEVEGAIDGSGRSGWAIAGLADGSGVSAVFVTWGTASAAAPMPLRLRMEQSFGGGHLLGRFRVSVSAHPLAALPLGLERVLGMPRASRASGDQAALRAHYLAHHAGVERARMARALAGLERRIAALRPLPSTMVLEDGFSRQSFILAGGLYDHPRAKVSCGVPESLAPMPPGAPMNRLGVARWMEPDHPLTARVAVNRAWQHFFGQGLVKTSEDFGTQGSLPTHPELLDWLATELVRSGWDQKHIHRLIATSATYQQSSIASADLLARDPENHLLARGPSGKLAAELIRDQALFAAGLLVERAGGPSVFPYQPAGLWEELNIMENYSEPYPVDHGDSLYRRSLYTFWKKAIPPPPMQIRDVTALRRSSTSTPLQALVLLDDPQWVEAARKLAERMLDAGGRDAGAAISDGFRRLTARRPTPEELRALRSVHDAQLAQVQGDRAAAERSLAPGDAPRRAPYGLERLSAMTLVARVILNLAETNSKE